MNALYNIPVLFEDSSIIAVNKPANMLSTPGKLENVMPPAPSVVTKKRRFQEWSTAILSADRFASGFEAKTQLKRLKGDAVPRKEVEFKRYVQRTLKEMREDVKNEMWKAVCEADSDMHKKPISATPLEFLSAFEILENRPGLPCKLYPVHRLDCETSGVLLFAKTAIAAADLSRQFRDREVHKLYVAEVAGRLPVDCGVVDASLGQHPDPAFKPRYVIDPQGKPSLTNFKVLRVYQSSEPVTSQCGSNATALSCDVAFQFDDREEDLNIKFSDCSSQMVTSVVKLEPVTGRSHQLRVHMDSIGCPMLGDSLYASPDVQTALDRLALHAYQIKFMHPTTREILHLTADLGQSGNYKKWLLTG